MSKYVGTYRVVAEIDKHTNDFCRNDKYELDNNQDVYIKCKSGVRVYYYGNSTLEVYIPSKNKGRNIVKEIYAKLINSNNSSISRSEAWNEKLNKTIERNSYSINDMKIFKEDTCKKGSLIFEIDNNDVELYFKIKDANFSKIVDILKPQTSGARYSPFATVNLPKDKVSYISEEQMKVYSSIVSIVKKEDKLKIAHANNRFLYEMLCKKLKLKKEEVVPEMKKLMCKIPDYISYKGLWDEYIEYLKKEINKLYD